MTRFALGLTAGLTAGLTLTLVWRLRYPLIGRIESVTDRLPGPDTVTPARTQLWALPGGEAS